MITQRNNQRVKNQNFFCSLHFGSFEPRPSSFLNFWAAPPSFSPQLLTIIPSHLNHHVRSTLDMPQLKLPSKLITQAQLSSLHQKTREHHWNLHPNRLCLPRRCQSVPAATKNNRTFCPSPSSVCLPLRNKPLRTITIGLVSVRIAPPYHLWG